MILRTLAWLALLWLAAVPARAEAPALVLGGEGHYDLAPFVSYLEDPRQELVLDDVLAPAQQARFRPMAADRPAANFGLTGSAMWLRVDLNATEGSSLSWLLELAYPPLDSIDLFTPDTSGAWRRQVAGDRLPFAARPVVHRNHVLPVRLPSGTSTIYLRVASEGTLAAPLRLWRPEALWQNDQTTYGLLAMYFGLLVGLLLYNLVLFLGVRDRTYLVYVLFVAAMALTQAALTGFGYQYLWPGQVWWARVAPPATLCLTALFGVLFARSFLASAQGMPVTDRLLLALALGWLATLGTALALPYVVSTWLVTVLAPVTVAVLVFSGVQAVRRGHGGARHYLAAWSVLLVGASVMFLHNTGLVPSNAFTFNALLIGSALEMVLLSFALAARINVARRFKEQAQARIAAERAMVEALSVSQKRLQTVLEEREVILQNSIVGIAFLTAEGRLRWANRAMFKAGDRPVQSMEPFYLSREEYLEVGGEVAAAAARGEVYQRELQVRQFDGTRIWILLSGKAVVHRRHEWVNEKFAQMLGYPRQVLVGQGSEYLHPDTESWQRFGAEARAALATTNAYACEMQLKRRNGELFWVLMAGSCVRPNDPESGVVWTFLDITERKRSEAGMREALEQQRELNALRSRFVAMTSHEFRTPLAQILSAEELLRHYGERLPADERLQTLDSISQGVQRMSRMLDRVLLIGRADAQMLEFHPTGLDLRALCRRLVEEARLQQPEALCVPVCDIGPGVGRGRWDEKLLRHILVNLLTNALKYSPAGGSVRLEVRMEGGDMVFRVRDEGIGIPPEELPHLFDSFHRASNVGDIPGTGLGLAIVKNAAERHGGTVEVESRLGAGATFTVRIPGGTGEDEPQDLPDAAAAETPEPG